VIYCLQNIKLEKKVKLKQESKVFINTRSQIEFVEETHNYLKKLLLQNREEIT